MLFLTCTRILLACFAVHCWLLVSLVYTRKGPKVLLSKAGFQPLSPQCAWVPGLFLHRGRTLHVSELQDILGCPLHLFRSLWTALHPYGVSTTPPSFVSSACFLRVNSDPSSRSSMKRLNSIVPISMAVVLHYCLASSWTSGH